MKTVVKHLMNPKFFSRIAKYCLISLLLLVIVTMLTSCENISKQEAVSLVSEAEKQVKSYVAETKTSTTFLEIPLGSESESETFVDNINQKSSSKICENIFGEKICYQVYVSQNDIYLLFGNNTEKMSINIPENELEEYSGQVEKLYSNLIDKSEVLEISDGDVEGEKVYMIVVRPPVDNLKLLINSSLQMAVNSMKIENKDVNTSLREASEKISFDIESAKVVYYISKKTYLWLRIDLKIVYSLYDKSKESEETIKIRFTSSQNRRSFNKIDGIKLPKEIVKKYNLTVSCNVDADCDNYQTCSEMGVCIDKITCQRLDPTNVKDPTRSLNIVFIGAGYTSNSILAHDIDQLLYSGGHALFNLRPFSSIKDMFNVYFIKAENHNHDQEGTTQIPPNRDITTYQKQCAIGDYFIVISPKPFRSYAEISLPILKEEGYYSSPGGITAFVSLEDKDRLVLAHEIGHLFGGLADEYTEEGNPDEPMYPNCAPSERFAKEWWHKEGIPGCSYDYSNLRAYENTIMNDDTIADSYGDINEAYILKRVKEKLNSKGSR